MEIYIARNGNREGPYPAEVVTEMLRKGDLQATDLAWRQGLNTWIPLSQIELADGPPPLPRWVMPDGVRKVSLALGLLTLPAWAAFVWLGIYRGAWGHRERFLVATLFVCTCLLINFLGSIVGIVGFALQKARRKWNAAGVLLNALQIILIFLFLAQITINRIRANNARRVSREMDTSAADLAVFQNTAGRAETQLRREKQYAWLLQENWGAYQQVGSRNEKWDAQAKELFTLYSRYLTQGESGDPEIYARLGDLGAELKSLGCDDPLVRFVAARFIRPRPAQTVDNAADCQAVAGDLTTRKYPAGVRLFAWLRAARSTALVAKAAEERGLQSPRELMDTAKSCLQEMIKDYDVPTSELYDACYQFLEASQGVLHDRLGGADQIDALFRDSHSNSPVRYQIRGEFYTDYAWDARGGGYANTVTAEGQRLMQARLKQAELALNRAWKLDPRDSRPSLLMLKVELGQGLGRDRMEAWFARALAADPDNYAACKAKLYYLEPKWYGSANAMLQFGRTCYQTQNWESGIPFILAEAHQSLAAYETNKQYYYTKPGVWADIQMVYSQYLLGHPKAARRRSQYARLAALCGQWKTANEQFNLLGDHVLIDVFQNRDEYEQLKKETSTMADLPKP